VGYLNLRLGHLAPLYHVSTSGANSLRFPFFSAANHVVV
jgi:hypothetical protein